MIKDLLFVFATFSLNSCIINRRTRPNCSFEIEGKVKHYARKVARDLSESIGQEKHELSIALKTKHTA